MKIGQGVSITLAMLAAIPGIAAAAPNDTGASSQMVVTARPNKGANQPATLEASEVTVLLGNASLPVVSLERLAGDAADMQLFILLDDSTRTASLGTQLRELKTFIEASAVKTEIAIGYMRNGSFGLVQPFTADHAKAASALRLPMAIPGENGSPYFALSDLVKHWPSKQPTRRRAVLMLTDGVDRYYSAATTDDPYVNASIHDALKQGVMVYSIYLQGAGAFGRNGWGANIAQSHLLEVSEKTGGQAFFQGLSDPVSISPFLMELDNCLDNQYLLTVEVLNEKGLQPVKLRTEVPNVKLSSAAFINVR
jgi:hypothetical protein